MIKKYNFTEQDKVGKLGEKLILNHYNSITDESGNKYHARATRIDEQLQGADLMVFNQSLKTNYIEVKTDTQIEETKNIALEYLIEQESGDYQVGCQMKTFADFMMYWSYPTNFVRYWNPKKLQPYIVTWIRDSKYKTVKVINENKHGDKWFAHCLLVPTYEFDKLQQVNSFLVSLNVLQGVLNEED